MNQQDSSQNYHRPNAKWICTADSGCGCPNGPLPNGSCASRSQCHPVKENDRWNCNRPPNRGGTCEKGPSPYGECCFENQGCVPKPSLRSKRKVFVVSALALVTGLVLIGIWTPNRNEFLAPGGLSSPHAQIWSGSNAEDRCIACHSAGDSGPMSWLFSLMGGEAHPRQPQYQKCLACHKDMMTPESALMAHNQSPETLANLTAQVTENHGRTGRRIFATPVNHNGELACANCHREHHGKDHNLAAMTDKQCQSCHANQFESFEHGHPEFRSFGQQANRGISFDHYSHQAKYFAEASKEFDCKSCHVGDGRTDVMATATFEEACADCHNKNIEASLTQGLPIFAVPMIDVELLKKNGLDIGQWPESATGTFDGKIPPAMKVLLAGDKEALAAMNTLGPDFDLFDIDIEDRKHLIAAYQLALSIKRLLLDLSNQGQTGLSNRLESLATNKISRSQLQQMVSGLGSETFLKAQEQWFPDIANEGEGEILKPGRFIPDASAKSIAPPPLAAGRSAHASYLQEEDEETLAANPLRGLYEIEEPVDESSDTDTVAKQPDSLAFENLPSQPESNGSPAPSDQAPATGKQGGQLTRVNKNEFKSGYRSGGAKAVANPFFDNKPPVPKQIPAVKSNSPKQDILTPNPISQESQPQTQEPVVVDPPENKSESQPSNKDSIDVSDLPIVIEENDFSAQEDSKQETLVENPLKALVGPEKKSEDNDLPNVSSTTKQNNPSNAKQLAAQEDKNKPDVQNNNQKSISNNLDPVPPLHLNPQTGVEKQSKKVQTHTDQEHLNKPQWNPKKLDPDQTVLLGGWYRDEETLTVSYRQSGHADAFTRNWYDFVTSIQDSQYDAALAEFTELIKSPTAPGQCGSCHAQVDQPPMTRQIQWKTRYRDVTQRQFTKFSHRPHLVQPGNNQCATCHELNPAASILAKTKASQQHPDFQSGFHPITKTNCVSCHNQQTNTQSCTQCHNYHVGHSANVKAALLGQ